MNAFLGFDHVDVRVRSVAQVEAFYDAILPALGLGRKSYAHVAADGEWHDVDDSHPANAVEFFERSDGKRPPRFIGFIEDAAMVPVATRLAFAVGSADELEGWEERLRAIGARALERSEDMSGYPALFFEDPAGTRLELCARNVRPSE
jgi:catechol 2,3-dioxygenase-like lactoylglutathione lyase family enzyme